jgi:Flp pilus assembly protein CpaB
MTYRVRNIVVAVVLAALAGSLTLVYVVNYKRHVQHGENKVNVLVAARDIPAGTTGSEVVEQHMLKTEAVPRRTLVPGWVGNADQLHNQVATQQIYEGEQVTVRRFAPPREQGVRSQIRGTERAVELAGDAHQTLAGTLKAGDNVDVVGEWTIPDGSSHHVTRVVLRNIYVLKAADAPSTGAKLGPNQDDSVVQLRLTDVQSQKMNYLYFNPTADWWLQLRPPNKSTDSPNTFEQDGQMLSDGPGRRWTH